MSRAGAARRIKHMSTPLRPGTTTAFSAVRDNCLTLAELTGIVSC